MRRLSWTGLHRPAGQARTSGPGRGPAGPARHEQAPGSGFRGRAPGGRGPGRCRRDGHPPARPAPARPVPAGPWPARPSAAARTWCPPPAARLRGLGRPWQDPRCSGGRDEAGRAARAGAGPGTWPGRTPVIPARTTSPGAFRAAVPARPCHQGPATCRHSPDQRLAGYPGPGWPRRTPVPRTRVRPAGTPKTGRFTPWCVASPRVRRGAHCRRSWLAICWLVRSPAWRPIG